MQEERIETNQVKNKIMVSNQFIIVILLPNNLRNQRFSVIYFIRHSNLKWFERRCNSLFIDSLEELFI